MCVDDSGSGPSSAARRAIERTLTVRAYRALDPPQQAVLRLALVDGMTADELARTLDTTPAGADAATARACDAFRREWLRLYAHDEDRSPRCRRTIARLEAGEHVAGAECARAADAHVEQCVPCALVAAHLDDLAHWLGPLLRSLAA